MKKKMIILLSILVVFSLGKNIIIKFIAEKGVEAVTGLPLTIQKFNFGVMDTKINIENLQVHNPRGFPDKFMVDMPKIYVDYSLKELLTGKIHLHDIRLDLKEFIVVKNKDGMVNLNSLKMAEDAKKEETKEQMKAPDIQIDNLELKIGKVIFKDYTKGTAPQIKEFNINLNEKHSNITNTNAVVSLIVFKVLTKTSLAGMTNVDPDTFKDIFNGAADTTKKVMDKTVDTAGQAAEKTTDTLKKTTEAITDTLKIPFGNENQ